MTKFMKQMFYESQISEPQKQIYPRGMLSSILFIDMLTRKSNIGGNGTPDEKTRQPDRSLRIVLVVRNLLT